MWNINFPQGRACPLSVCSHCRADWTGDVTTQQTQLLARLPAGQTLSLLSLASWRGDVTEPSVARQDNNKAFKHPDNICEIQARAQKLLRNLFFAIKDKNAF